MITTPKRHARKTTSLPMWLLHLLLASLCVVNAKADEVDAKINAINDTLRQSQEEAVKKALVEMRVVAAELVKKGDPRRDRVSARCDELERELDKRINPADLRKWEKAFEAIEDRGGWWWVDQNKPDVRGPWYRLDRAKKRLVHWNNDANGRPMKVEEYCATYQIVDVDDADQDIILVKVTYEPQGTEPGRQDTFRFNKKTGVLQTSYGWYGKPK